MKRGQCTLKFRFFVEVSTFRIKKVQKQPPEVFLEISQNPQENTCARVSILIKLRAWGKTLRYFLVFGLSTGKYGPEKTPYLDTFHAVEIFQKALFCNSTATQIWYKTPFELHKRSVFEEVSHFVKV